MTIGIDRYYIVKVSHDGGGVNSWFIPRLRPQPLWPFRIRQQPINNQSHRLSRYQCIAVFAFATVISEYKNISPHFVEFSMNTRSR